MRKIIFVGCILALFCGCKSNDTTTLNDPIVSPTNISNQNGNGEVQIPHYTPTWYEK